jgi:hypothetical protein
MRADSAFYGHAAIASAVNAGAQVSVTVRMDTKVKAAIANIAPHAWTTIEYTDAIYDPESGRWISRAEVAEVAFTAFSSRKRAEQVTGRLVVRRIPDLTTPANPDQATLFDLWRFHALCRRRHNGCYAEAGTMPHTMPKTLVKAGEIGWLVGIIRLIRSMPRSGPASRSCCPRSLRECWPRVPPTVSRSVQDRRSAPPIWAGPGGRDQAARIVPMSPT